MNVDRPPDLVPGRSARDLVFVGGVLSIAGAAMLVVIGVASLLSPPWREIVMTSAFVVGVVLGAIAIWAGVSLAGAIEREREAGYTTLYGRYRELWQLDHRTGEVLRRPGEREVRRRPRDEA